MERKIKTIEFDLFEGEYGEPVEMTLDDLLASIKEVTLPERAQNMRLRIKGQSNWSERPDGVICLAYDIPETDEEMQTREALEALRRSNQQAREAAAERAAYERLKAKFEPTS